MEAFLRELFSDYTLRTVTLGAALLGLVSGGLGTFAVLRKQSLLGDAISHAALPGIALGFLLTGSRHPLALVLGAAAAGWIGALVVMAIVGTTRIKHDSALGLVLSVFFGVGLVLLTYIQNSGKAGQAGLDRFLFGQAATLVEQDLVVIGGLGAIAVAVTLLFWKEFKLLSFDPAYAATLGLPIRAIDILLTTVLVIAIVVGLQTVGVVLMSAMLVAPAAAARQWTDRLGAMVAIAGGFGALAGATGAILSSGTAHLPTGPTIVLAMTTVVVLSLLLAPRRGVVWSWARHQRSRRSIRTDSVLLDLYGLAAQHADPGHGHAAAVIEAGRGGVGVRRTLDALESRGHAERQDGDRWAITRAGSEEAERLLASERKEEER